MSHSAVANPRVTLNIIPRDQRVGLDDQRILVVGQKLTGGAAPAGLNTDIGRSAAEINTAFGARSHLALVCRRLRKINPNTNLDVIALADAGSPTKATGVVAFSGTATGSGSLTIISVDGNDHTYTVDGVTGDTAATVATKFETLMDADPIAPFVASVSTATLTMTAENGGKVANDWPLIVKGSIPGITVTLTAWGSGATDPTLTTILDAVANIRYQTIVWPSQYATTVLKTFLEARKNLDNDIKDGIAFIGTNRAFADVKSDALALNSSEMVLITNEPETGATWKGAHLPQAPDLTAASFAAARARRFEDGILISDIVATNEFRDQFGGISKCSLPYFNTPILYCGQPLRGSGYTQEEQQELEDAGVSVVGYNRSNTAVVMGVVVTTWQKDVAGNDDDTWKFLEWRDTHGTIREYFVKNIRKEFSQHRMTAGTAVAGFAIIDEASVRAFLYQLYDELAEECITVKGLAGRRKFEENLVVTLKPALRRVEIAADVPMVSQFGEAIGSIKFNFLTQ
jgi:phage tail sheath gpL-like